MMTGADMTGADMIGLLGFSGLTGLVGLVGLLIDFTQVFDVITQTLDHTGLPYGFGHVLVCCCVTSPVYPV